jgi:HMG box factor
MDGDLGRSTAQAPATGPQQARFASKRAKRTIGRINYEHPVASPTLRAPAFAESLPVRTQSSQIWNSPSSRPVKSAASKESIVQFCLCQTGCKVPRPKNCKAPSVVKHGRPADGKHAGFFLYREHSQAAAVARNPGLGSADISKIIGAQWKKLPQETKDKWHALAKVCSPPPFP